MPVADLATKWSPKDPADIVDLWFNWDTSLPDAVVIVAETTTIDTAGTLNKVTDSFEDRRSRIRVDGGALGIDYAITNTVDLSDGQRFQITKTLQVRERTK